MTRPAFRIVPPVGTPVVHTRTGQRGQITGNAGFEGNAPVALVLFDGRPYEDVVFVRLLTHGEPEGLGEDDE